MQIRTRVLLSLACVPIGLFAYVQGPSPQPQRAGIRPEFSGLLDFEADHADGVPKGWGGGPPGTFAVDSQIVHGGRWSLRLERDDKSPSGFTAVTKMVPIDFSGAKLELRGFLRTENVSEFAGLWMREDGDSGSVAFDNMQKRQLKGTTGWTEYSIELPLNKDAKRLIFGVLAAGVGKVWADDLRLLVDGKPIESVPRLELPKTVLDTDREFEGGSGIVLKDLTTAQIANLAMLGKVWGFVKYHHPLVTSGQASLGLRALPRPAEGPERGRRDRGAIRGESMDRRARGDVNPARRAPRSPKPTCTCVRARSG